MATKVLLAMSGGVDSSIAAIILKNMGYEVVGITMKLWQQDDKGNLKFASNKSVSTILDASLLAAKMNIAHHIMDFSDFFEKNVIGNFADEYLKGRTPNPCVLCNKILKWGKLLAMADELGCEKVATGHYARIRVENNRHVLYKGMDINKDQSYVLWRLPQSDLARTIFPLGDMRKEDIKKMAAEYGFVELSEKKESYDVCFIPDNDYRCFLKERIPGLEESVSGGDFVLSSGKTVGKHEGFPFYTIGQRKGLGIAMGDPMYVNKIDAENNRVFIGTKNEVMSRNLICDNINSVKYECLPTDNKVVAKIRYHDAGTFASLSYINGDSISVAFDNDVSAITPGQSVVFYENDDVLGGGIISDFNKCV